VQDELTHAPTEIAAKPRETITATNILVATGSVARELPFAKFDGDKIMGAREAMNTKARPESLVVIGSGAIGMEFAYFYNAYGTKVTVIEMLDRILPVEDVDISKNAEKIFKKGGMDIRTSTTTTNVEKTKKGVKVTVAPMKDGKVDESKAETIEADKVLLAIGVKGRYDGLFDDSLGIAIEREHIKTDYSPPAPGTDSAPVLTYATSVPGVYAVGDVIGMLKILVHQESRTILGVHCIGSGATEIIHIGQTLMAFNGTVDYFVNTVFNYPTFAECYKVAALNAVNKLAHA